MKSIVVYFSLEGNSKYVADRIAEYVGADTLGLEPVKKYPTGNVSKFVWGGKSVVFGDKPKLLPYKFDAKDYDVIIIGTPVWAGTFAPPLKTFLREHDLSHKKVALYACCGGGSTEKCIDNLKKELKNCEIIGSFSLVDPGQKQSEENIQTIKAFCSKHLS